MSISGNIHDTKLALQMLDHARETIAGRLPRQSAVIVPHNDVAVTPSSGFPALTQYGDVAPELVPKLRGSVPR